MTRDELLNQIQHDRLELEGLLGQASDSVRTAPVLANGWSIKDLLAHLGFWERRAVSMYQFLNGGPEPDPKPGSLTFDELNAQVHAAYQDMNLADAVESEQRAYQAIFNLAKDAPEADLFDPQRFGWTEGRPFSGWILDNTAGHYQEHLPDLRGWLGRPG
jgi:hypothetical protein